ncbi:MAG: response regulator [Phaeodactylibacter sp.]|nr:response regulator [Phaeodactylibacter sp.]MCB9263610.1 response regulator [Lewinellaceae bacterium]MCB9287510.1 response regulator [Lewinellaceae bacterium]
MIKAIIVDDEEHARLTLAGKLGEYFPNLRVIGMAANAEEAFQLIINTQPNLVFLDVAMPRESGFSLLRRLPSLDFEVIFVTGFDKYAIDAIDFCALGYILKPIEDERLIRAVRQARKRILEKQENIRNRELLQNLSSPGHSSNKIGIPTVDGLEFIATDKIMRCEGQQKCTQISIKGRSPITSSYNIGEFIRLLKPYGFFPVHKSHLINLAFISKYNKEGTVILENGDRIPVSKRRRSDFLDRISRL